LQSGQPVSRGADLVGRAAPARVSLLSAWAKGMSVTVTSGFCRRLRDADQDGLIAELERIAGVSIDSAIAPAADLADAATNGQQLQ
jgi:hypothetical protein